MQYQGCELFRELMDKVKEDKPATDEDYERIERWLRHDDVRLLRRFYKSIPDASEMDKRVFLLYRFGLKKSEASVLVAHERTALAKVCDRMFEKAVGRKPSNRAEAYNWILEF